MGKILIIEDNETMREGLARIVKSMGHEPITAENGIKGVGLFSSLRADFVITDLKMNEMDGLEVLSRIKEKDREAIVLVITGYGSIETAVEAMKLGAIDFITKPFAPDVIRVKINTALRIKTLTRERNRLSNIAQYYHERDLQDYPFEEIVGRSSVITVILDRVKQVARSDASVLITGESGTGKELIARAIHYSSPRAQHPFIKVNCGSLAEGVLESELFGHEKGAFTGAIKRKIGRFELADSGTIFLDEIGDFSANIQLKLLRVLQEREFERVGGADTIKVDVRVISATNKNLSQAINDGTFREDLYYRLHIIPIHIPPLRERREDIEALVTHFMARLNQKSTECRKEVSRAAMDALKAYHWPGNVRELENVIEQAYVLTDKSVVDVEKLPALVCDPSRNNRFLQVPKGTLSERLEELEKALIEKAYQEAKGVKAEAARILGVKTSALYYKLDKYNIGDRKRGE